MAAAGGRCGISVLPRQYRSWISPRDPGFEAKATVILDLYQGFYQGRRLRPGDRILSVDAKPSIQARGRCHPLPRPRPASPSGSSMNTSATAPSPRPAWQAEGNASRLSHRPANG